MPENFINFIEQGEVPEGIVSYIKCRNASHYRVVINGEEVGPDFFYPDEAAKLFKELINGPRIHCTIRPFDCQHSSPVMVQGELIANICGIESTSCRYSVAKNT